MGEGEGEGEGEGVFSLLFGALPPLLAPYSISVSFGMGAVVISDMACAAILNFFEIKIVKTRFFSVV